MKNMKNIKKRGLALFLALVMCLSMINMSALAAVADTDPGADAAVLGTETFVEGESGTPADGEDAIPAGGDNETPAEGENETLSAGEDVIPAEGEDTTPADGEEVIPAEGEDTTPADGEEVIPAEGEDETPAEGEDEDEASADGEDEDEASADGEDEDETPADGEDEAPAEGEDEDETPAEGEDEDEASADGEDEDEDAAECICQTKCGEEANAECPVCGADDADLAEVCTGEEDAAPSEVTAFVDGLSALVEKVEALTEKYADDDENGPTEDELADLRADLDALTALYEAIPAELLEDTAVAEAKATMDDIAAMLETMELALNFSTEPVAKIGDTEYLLLAFAVAKANAGDVITLLADVAESITVSQSLTFDLDGHTWTGKDNTTLTIDLSDRNAQSAVVTVQNGNMTSVAGYRAIETLLATTLNAASATADVNVSNVNFTTSGDISKEAMVALDGSNARQVGGVIYVQNSDLTVADCTFTGAANVYGTHIAISPKSKAVHPTVNLTITNSTFTGADSTYGAVHVAVESSVTGRGAKVNISGSTFTENNRGLYLSATNSLSKPVFDVSVTGCTFEKNTNAGICVNNNDKNNANVANFTLNVNNSNFLDNTGPAVGMAGSSSRATVNISGGEISRNVLSSGSVINVYGPFTMDGTTVSNNKAYLVMDLENTNTVTIKNATISDNESTNSSDVRGAIYIAPSANATVEVSGSRFTGNSGRHGGAVYIGGTNLTANIANCTISGNTAKFQGGGIYLSNTGTTTISDTTITDNTANWSLSTNATTFGNAGGGLYVMSTSGTVTLTGSTRIYNNHTPNDKQIPGTNDGGSADIALYSTTLSSSATAKNPDSYTRANLVLDIEKSFVGENGSTYTLTKFDRFLLNTSNGWYYVSSKYSWPMGYYTTTEEPLRVYLGTEGQHTAGDKVITTTSLAEAVEAAKQNSLDTVYVCNNVTITAADEEILNNSGITFARCAEHPNGHMFTISGDVTLNGAHIDGKSEESNSALIFVPGSGHLTITGDTRIENGVNTGNGGAIQLNQGGLTMTGGVITNNTANQGGGIYAYGNINGAKIVFEGGTVSANTATGGNGGGGAYIGAISSEFGVAGGRTTFDGNKASQLGGGVFIVNGTNANTHHFIYKATFTNNESHRDTGYYYDGGAIYIQSGTTVHMKNVYVSGNSDGDPRLAKNYYTAVAVCPTGELAVYELDGLLSVNNGKNPDIGVIAGGAVPETDPKVYLPSHAIGGGDVSYTTVNGTEVDISEYQFMEGYFRLYTKATDSVINAARETAERDGVIITGNYATQYGSGIMTNGILKIGTEKTTLRVNKVWADGAENHEDDQILVYLTRDKDVVPKDFREDSYVILDKDNNWTYTWTNLGNEFEWGVAEATAEGYLSAAPVVRDTEYAAIADRYFIATLTNTPGNNEHNNKLVITKTALGLDPDASYKFTLTLENVLNENLALQVGDQLYPIYNNTVEFALKSGETAVVYGLPDGFSYEVTEAEGNYSSAQYDRITLNEDGTGNIYWVNVFNYGTVDIEVEKKWTGDGYEANLPDSITVDLMNDDVKVGTATLTAENGWKHTFTGLPANDNDNEPITYTVKETGMTDADRTVAHTVQQDGTNKWIVSNKDGVVLGSFTSTQERNGTTVIITNTWENATDEGTGTFTFTKMGHIPGKDDKTLAGATFTLTKDGDSEAEPEPMTATSDANGKVTFNFTLGDEGTWTLAETEAPDGYTTLGETWTVEVSKEFVSAAGTKNTYKMVAKVVDADNENKEITFTTVTNQYKVGNLTVTKNVSWNADKSSEPDKNDEFTVVVTLGDATASDNRDLLAGETAYVGDGTYVFKLKAGQSATITGIPVGTQYTVTEPANTMPDGYARTDENSAGTIAEGDQKVTVENHYFKSKTTSLEVTKTFKGGENYLPESVKVQLLRGEEVVEEVNLTDTNNWTHTWENLPVYATEDSEASLYTVQEVSVTYPAQDKGGYTADERGTSNIIRVRSGNKGEDGKFEIVGGWIISESAVTAKAEEEGSGLTAAITNTWRGATELGNTSFSVYKIDSETEQPLSGVTFTLTKGEEKFELTTGSDGIVTFDALTAGTYTLTETAAPKAYNWNGNVGRTWTIKVVKDGLASVEEVDEANSVGKNTWNWKPASEGIALDDVTHTGTLVVANSIIKGSISITKQVEGDNGEAADKSFTFTVTGPNNYRESVTVKADATETLTDLPYGEYTIIESGAALDGYTWNGVSFDDSEPAPDKSITVTVSEHGHIYAVTATNKYTKQQPETGSLTITKVVNGGGEEAANKEYKFTVTGPDGYSENVTITGANSVTIEGLQPGTYTVTEDTNAAEISGYTWSGTGNGSVELKANSLNGTVTITNNYTPPNNPENPNPSPSYTSLTVKKVWAGDDASARPSSIKVQRLRDGVAYGSPVTLRASNNWKYTWNNLSDNYSWSAEEIEVPEGYVSTSEQDGRTVTITNTYTPDETDIPEDPTPTTDIPDDPTPPPTPDTPDTPDEPTDIPDEDVPTTDIPDDEPPVDLPDEQPPLTDIPDEQPPLITWPVTPVVPVVQPPVVDVPDENPPLIALPSVEDIPDDPIPMIGIPQTGDISLAWYAVALLSLCGLVVLGLKKREEENEI